MFLEKITDVIVKQEMTIPIADPLASQTVRVALDRSYPLEKIFIVASAVVGVATTASVAADGLLALFRRITLEINGGTKPRKVVDASGADLVELALHEQCNIDRDTAAAFGPQAPATGKNIAASVVRIVIPINLPSPQLVDPLRTLFLLPLQNHPNDAQLTIETGTKADVDKGAATFTLTSFSFEVVTVRRLMPRWYNQQIISEGGYVDFDMLATEFLFPNSGEQKLDIPAPGYYFNLLLRHYTTALLRADVSAAGNDLWRLEVQNSVMRRFRMKHLEMENDMSRVVTQTLSAALTLTNQGAGSVGAMAFLDFISDETGADVNELGSVLDTTLPQAAGQKCQLIGTVTGGAAVKTRIIGRRALDDISRFQVVRGKQPGT